MDIDRYRLIFEHSMDGILLTSSDGVIHDANPAACEILRGPRDAICALGSRGVTVDDLALQAVMQERDQHGSARSEVLMTRVGGEVFPAEISLSAYSNPSGITYTSLIFRDITERRALEQEILQMTESLEETVRQRTARLRASNDALQNFAYALAHDLNVPLIAVGGLCGTIEQKEPALAAAELARIRANVHEMGEMIDSLQALALIGRSQVKGQWMDLASVALSCRDGLEIDVPHSLPVYGDPQLLSLVITELLANASKFAQPGTPPRVRITADRLGFCVSDDGVGFPSEQASNLFRPFQRLHPHAQFPGQGMGLVKVASVVQLHDGEIKVDSAPGRGAAFHVHLWCSGLPQDAVVHWPARQESNLRPTA